MIGKMLCKEDTLLGFIGYSSTLQSTVQGNELEQTLSAYALPLPPDVAGEGRFVVAKESCPGPYRSFGRTVGWDFRTVPYYR